MSAKISFNRKMTQFWGLGPIIFLNFLDDFSNVLNVQKLGKARV